MAGIVIILVFKLTEAVEARSSSIIVTFTFSIPEAYSCRENGLYAVFIGIPPLWRSVTNISLLPGGTEDIGQK
jgi:hypothetical protein